MQTLNDVLCFLNELDFAQKINDGDDVFEKLSCVKRRLVIEFEDYNVPKLIKVLNSVGVKNLSLRTDKK